MRATHSRPVNQISSVATDIMSQVVARDPLDVELPMDGTRQACGAIITLSVCGLFWGAVIALVLR